VVPVVIRRYVRSLIAEQFFEVPVLSYPEIARPFKLNVISRIEPSQQPDAA
jgi:type III secretory pathway component EscV